MKYKNIFKDVVFVSQLTGVDKKKIRILLSVILANLTVFFDILVILVFANLIDKSNINEAFYVKFIADNLFLLPSRKFDTSAGLSTTITISKSSRSSV